MRDAIPRLIEIQRAVREALRASLVAQSAAQLSRSARDDLGDTIFGIDVVAEEVLLPRCEAWGKQQCFVLVAEGIEPEGGRLFGRPGASGPELRVIFDPIDGTRGLMYDKRSAWCLAAVAPERGAETRLSDLQCAVMTELPTSRAACGDVLWAKRGGGAQGWREWFADGDRAALPVVPTARTDLAHGFASVANFFQGGKELTARVEEEILRRAHGGWNPDKAEIYTDQYISSGGQLAELALGRDRFVLDVRPLVHRALGVPSSLCSRPYDLCTALIATEAGCVVTAPDGGALDAPLDTTTNVAFAGYANAGLAALLQPIVRDVLIEHGLLTAG